jgi:hypothetical protein
MYIVLLLTTEFWHIDFFGGSMRAYAFVTPLALLLAWPYVNALARNGLFWALLAFLGACAVSATLAAMPSQAWFSLGLLASNMSIAFAVGLIVAAGWISPASIIRVTLAVAVIGVLFGVLQLVLFKGAGISLALSPEQLAQLQGGFVPGFKTEANTFAKFLNVAVLLYLPVLLVGTHRRRAFLIAGVLVLGLLLTFTRSVIYGLAITLALIYLVHTVRKQRVVNMRALAWAVAGIAGIAVFASVVANFNDYAALKLKHFFNLQATLSGGSALVRLASQDAVWNAFVHSGKSLLLGVGWGQVMVQQSGEMAQAGGGELVSALGFGGVLGGLLYIAYMVMAFVSARRARRTAPNREARLAASGVLYAVLGLLVTGQMNGATLAPEYWMVFGLAMAFPCVARRQTAVRTRMAPAT